MFATLSDMTWGFITLFLIGKLGITSAFGVVYVHTAEMLPTVVRSGGVGSASTVARVGALLAPFVPLLVFVLTQLCFFCNKIQFLGNLWQTFAHAFVWRGGCCGWGSRSETT